MWSGKKTNSLLLPCRRLLLVDNFLQHFNNFSPYSNLVAIVWVLNLHLKGFQKCSFLFFLFSLTDAFYCKVNCVYFAWLTSGFKATLWSWTPARFQELKAPLCSKVDLYSQSLANLQRNAKITGTADYCGAVQSIVFLMNGHLLFSIYLLVTC